MFFISCDVFAFTLSDVFCRCFVFSFGLLDCRVSFPEPILCLKSVLKIESGFVLLFSYFYFLYDASLAWRDVAPIKSCCFLIFSPKSLTQDRFQPSTEVYKSGYLLVLSLPTKQPYFTTLTFKVFLFVKISLFMYCVFLQSCSVIVIGEMKFSSSRWKLHFDWTSFLMQSPINIMSFAVFSENEYRCDFWVDKKIEHLNVLGKTDGIFVLGKTLSVKAT